MQQGWESEAQLQFLVMLESRARGAGDLRAEAQSGSESRRPGGQAKNMNNSQNFSFITTWSCFATFTTAGQKEAVESQYGRFLV